MASSNYKFSVTQFFSMTKAYFVLKFFNFCYLYFKNGFLFNSESLILAYRYDNEQSLYVSSTISRKIIFTSFNLILGNTNLRLLTVVPGPLVGRRRLGGGVEGLLRVAAVAPGLGESLEAAVEIPEQPGLAGLLEEKGPGIGVVDVVVLLVGLGRVGTAVAVGSGRGAIGVGVLLHRVNRLQDLGPPQEAVAAAPRRRAVLARRLERVGHRPDHRHVRYV